jgi:beta-glucanase (GH16 family)
MTKSIKITFAFLLLVLLVNSCKQSDPIKTDFKLMWFDEFDGDELDLTKWEVQIGDGCSYGICGWGNNEKQYYRKENIAVSDGKLKIKSIKENFGGYEYTSARIRTINKGDFKYGKIEASVRMDSTKGLWHAFWMLPSKPNAVWPRDGEIDILEYVGKDPNQILNYIHFGLDFENRKQLGHAEPIVRDNNFHKYSVIWDENRIRWFLDDKLTFQVLRNDEAIADLWPFDGEFHLLLNTAIGGNLGGNEISKGLESAKYMEVDFVRVYQAK